MNTDQGIPRGFAALHTPAGYARRYRLSSETIIAPIKREDYGLLPWNDNTGIT